LLTSFDFGTFELATTGAYKLLGWVYDFRPLMKKSMFVKQHGVARIKHPE
jgi:hypothetical protein